MIDELLDLPSHLRKRLARALETGMLAPPYSAPAVRAIVATGEGTDGILSFLARMEHLEVPGRAAAAWIRSLEQASGRVPRPDLVWSGPEVPGLHARDTRRVYEELWGTAQRSIWASSYAYFDGKKAFKILAQRMDAIPGLRVTLLLNIQRASGDTTSADSMVRKFAERLWEKEWPGQRRPRVFYDPRALDPGRPGGVLHAKATVADDEAVFVTSANFTEAALDRNIELGLLLRDPALAKSVTRHFERLIEEELLHALPSA